MTGVASNSEASEDLPYVVELWVDGSKDTVERILARATNERLAREILKAAKVDYPDRNITIRKGLVPL